MKIAEIILEASPAGTSKVSAFFGKAANAANNIKSGLVAQKEKMFGTEKVKLAKQNQQTWYSIVKRKQQSNINMNDENVYRDELYKFLGSNGKLKLSRELKRMVGQLPLVDNNILTIMSKSIDDRIAAKAKKANAPTVSTQTGELA
jgi:hypothetical protein